MSNVQKAEQLKKEFEEAFGGRMTFRQLWFVIKCCKTVRKFARSNTALNNLFNNIFSGVATFKQVDKTVPDWKNPGSTKVIQSLQIRMMEITEIEDDSSGDEE